MGNIGWHKCGSFGGFRHAIMVPDKVWPGRPGFLFAATGHYAGRLLREGLFRVRWYDA